MEERPKFMGLIGGAVNDGDCSGHPNAVQVTHNSVLFDKRDFVLLVLRSLLLLRVST